MPCPRGSRWSDEQPESGAPRHGADIFQGADITGSMRPYFLSATYTDKEADGTDDLQLKLQDRDDIWLKKWLADAIDAAASAGSLSASSKAKTDGAAKSYKVTAKSGLNVRSGPSTSYGKYGALVCGAELQVEGIENGWAKVSYNGKTAYVSASYIKESGGGGGDASAADPAPASGAGFKISAVFVRENWTGGGRDKVLDCGQFELDSVDASGPPNTITIKATLFRTAHRSVRRRNPRHGRPTRFPASQTRWPLPTEWPVCSSRQKTRPIPA